MIAFNTFYSSSWLSNISCQFFLGRNTLKGNAKPPLWTFLTRPLYTM